MWDNRKFVTENETAFQILDAVSEGITVHKPTSGNKVKISFHAEGGYTGGWVWFDLKELIDWLTKDINDNKRG